MTPSALASGSQSLICPSCEAGELSSNDHQNGVRCQVCGHAPSRSVLGTLQQIIALPDALGSHACECGHPEMRRLPKEYPSVRPAVRRSYRQDLNAACRPSARAEVIADPVAEIPTYRQHRRNSARGALCERRKEVTYERSFPQATGACGDVANIRAKGGLKDVEAN